MTHLGVALQRLRDICFIVVQLLKNPMYVCDLNRTSPVGAQGGGLCRAVCTIAKRVEGTVCAVWVTVLSV
jgi:hypothetical protein